MAPIRVAIIDDHALVADWARHMLETVAGYDVVGVAHSEGLDQKAIADAMSVSVSMLKRQLQSIARKLDAVNSVDAAVEAARRGLI